MHSKHLFSLTYMPLLIRLKCKEIGRLPRFLGSTLHGVMGWVLANKTEVYRFIFENRRYGHGNQDIVNPYILEPPRLQGIYYEGDMLCFQFILLGKAVNYTNSVVEALVNASPLELGADRAKFELVDIIQSDSLEPIWHSGSASTIPSTSSLKTIWEQKGISRCSIHLLTPLRIRRGGEHLREIDFATIIRNITRRVGALTERYGGYVDAEAISTACELASSIQTTSYGLYWSELSRYSNRRNMKMDLSGLLGAMTCEGDLYHIAPWLHAARRLHIGRNVTFGCGQLDVVFG